MRRVLCGACSDIASGAELCERAAFKCDAYNMRIILFAPCHATHDGTACYPKWLEAHKLLVARAGRTSSACAPMAAITCAGTSDIVYGLNFELLKPEVHKRIPTNGESNSGVELRVRCSVLL